MTQLFLTFTSVICIEHSTGYDIFAGSVKESAISSILGALSLFKELVGRNQDFMSICLLNLNNLVGCGMNH